MRCGRQFSHTSIIVSCNKTHIQIENSLTVPFKFTSYPIAIGLTLYIFYKAPSWGLFSVALKPFELLTYKFVTFPKYEFNTFSHKICEWLLLYRHFWHTRSNLPHDCSGQTVIRQIWLMIKLTLVDLNINIMKISL